MSMLHISLPQLSSSIYKRSEGDSQVIQQQWPWALFQLVAVASSLTFLPILLLPYTKGSLCLKAVLSFRL